MYRSRFCLIVDIDDYEAESRLQTKCATYKEIQVWVKQKYGIFVNYLSIAQAKERCGLAKSEYKGHKAAEGYRAPKLSPKKEEAIRQAFLWFGMIKNE